MGRDGTDHLYGNDGNDTINGGNQNDFIRGDAGNDTLNGDAGDDLIFGKTGDDILRRRVRVRTVWKAAGATTFSRVGARMIPWSVRRTTTSCAAGPATMRSMAARATTTCRVTRASIPSSGLKGMTFLTVGQARTCWTAGPCSLPGHDVASYQSSQIGLTIDLAVPANSTCDALATRISVLRKSSVRSLPIPSLAMPSTIFCRVVVPWLALGTN